jgi:hypothetical protein
MGWPLYCSDGCIIFPQKIGGRHTVCRCDIFFWLHIRMYRWASRCVKVKIETPFGGPSGVKKQADLSGMLLDVFRVMSIELMFGRTSPLAQVLCRLKWAHDASLVPIYSRGKKCLTLR